jgi:hypothetical protein
LTVAMTPIWICSLFGMQPTLGGEKQRPGKRPGATPCFPDTKPVCGMPGLPPNLLERDSLAGNDQEVKEAYE